MDAGPRADDRNKIEDHVKMDDRVDRIGYIGAQDRPQRPTFLRPELDVVSTTSDAAPFVDDVLTHFHEWDALPQALKDNLSFDKYLTQKCEHSRGRPTTDRQRPRYTQLSWATGKMTLAHFDRSGRVTVRA